MTDAVQVQRDYYARTADHYDAMHVAADDEHGTALAAFTGLCQLHGARSILDVGAGTGRAVDVLTRRLPDAFVVGVEPVAALRQVGHDRGVPADRLIAGQAEALPFERDSFDFVMATGVMHHLPHPDIALAEMIRVARVGVMISDSNCYGQGGAVVRRIKVAARALGLWNMVIRLQTRGKMHKWSEGDGVYYSYSLFDSVSVLRKAFPRVTIMNTTPLDGYDLREGAGHAMVVAMAARTR